MNDSNTQSPESSGSRPRVPYALLLFLGVVPSLLWAVLGASSGPVTGSQPLYLILQAIGAAFAVVIITLCVVHFRRSGEVSAPVLGIGIMCTGLLDLWQAGWVAQVGGELNSYVLVTWAFARAVFVIALLVGAAVSPMTERVRGEVGKKKSTRLAIGVGCVFFVVSLVFMLSIHGDSGRADQLWGGELTRASLRFGPLALLLVAAGYVLPVFRKWHQSALSRVLIIACLPLILAQVHFIFNPIGSEGLHFLIANFAKLAAYSILFAGLLIDYDESYANLDRTTRKLKEEAMVSEQAQGAMSQNDHFFDTVMANMNTPVCFLDSSLKAIRVNDALARLGGFCMGPKTIPMLAIGKTAVHLFGDDAGAKIEGSAREVLETGVKVDDAEPWATTFPDGETGVYRWQLHPVVLSGETVSVLLIGTPEEE